jgi:hypothetical protein
MREQLQCSSCVTLLLTHKLKLSMLLCDQPDRCSQLPPLPPPLLLLHELLHALLASPLSTHLLRRVRKLLGSPAGTKPSCPKWLLPHTNMCPLLVSAALWASPAASCTTGSAHKPSTRVGVCLQQHNNNSKQQQSHEAADGQMRTGHHHCTNTLHLIPAC